MQMTAAVVVGVPCFFRDGCSCYLSALLELYHRLKTFALPGTQGRPRQARKEPHPELGYGQVVNKKRQGHRHELVDRVYCGSERLAQLGLSISSSLIERLHLP